MIEYKKEPSYGVIEEVVVSRTTYQLIDHKGIQWPRYEVKWFWEFDAESRLYTERHRAESEFDRQSGEAVGWETGLDSKFSPIGDHQRNGVFLRKAYEESQQDTMREFEK